MVNWFKSAYDESGHVPVVFDFEYNDEVRPVEAVVGVAPYRPATRYEPAEGGFEEVEEARFVDVDPPMEVPDDVMDSKEFVDAAEDAFNSLPHPEPEDFE